MAPGAQTEIGSAEIYFAKKLANNDKKVRDKAVKRLKIWLNGKEKSKNGLLEVELLKIWKGLFYCMWFSDKPLIQEELAENLSNGIHLFGQCSMTGVLFSKVFFITMGREWLGIDRHRLDKFYLLTQKFLHESLVFLSQSTWNERLTTESSKYFSDLLNDPLYPDGLKMFLAEKILSELWEVCKITARLPNEDAFLLLLEPFCLAVAHGDSHSVVKTVRDEVLSELLNTEIRKEEIDGDKDLFCIPYHRIADRLCKLGTDKKIQTFNRKIIFSFVEKYQKRSEEIDVIADGAEVVKKNRKRKKNVLVTVELNNDKKVGVKKQKRKSKLVENGIMDKCIYNKDDMILNSVLSDIREGKKNNFTQKEKSRESVQNVIQEIEYQVAAVSSNVKAESLFTEENVSLEAKSDNVRLTLNFSPKEEAESNNVESRKAKAKQKQMTKNQIKNKKSNNRKNANDEPKPAMSFVKTPPPNAFFRKALLKTEPTKKRTKIVTEKAIITPPCSEPCEKKVRIDVSRNIAVGHQDLKISPMTPFSPTRRPTRSALRTPASTRRNDEDFF